MSWIRTVDPGEAEGPLRAIYEAARRRAGRVWNIVRLMSRNPSVLEASLGLYQRIMHGPSGLSRREREMVATVVSSVNGCHY
jgi:uncharacterized peroxidase-related enzyme